MAKTVPNYLNPLTSEHTKIDGYPSMTSNLRNSVKTCRILTIEGSRKKRKSSAFICSKPEVDWSSGCGDIAHVSSSHGEFLKADLRINFCVGIPQFLQLVVMVLQIQTEHVTVRSRYEKNEFNTTIWSEILSVLVL